MSVTQLSFSTVIREFAHWRCICCHGWSQCLNNLRSAWPAWSHRYECLSVLFAGLTQKTAFSCHRPLLSASPSEIAAVMRSPPVLRCDSALRGQWPPWSGSSPNVGNVSVASQAPLRAACSVCRGFLWEWWGRYRQATQNSGATAYPQTQWAVFVSSFNACCPCYMSCRMCLHSTLLPP